MVSGYRRYAIRTSNINSYPCFLLGRVHPALESATAVTAIEDKNSFGRPGA